MNAEPHVAGGRAAACVLSSLILALGAVGCNVLPGTPVRDAYGDIPPVTYEERMTLWNHICFWTKPLPRALPVRRVQQGQLPTGNLKVVVEVRNNTARELRIDYQFRYYDADGVEIEQGPWTLRILEPRLDSQLASNSVGTRAKRFNLHIRRAR